MKPLKSVSGVLSTKEEIGQQQPNPSSVLAHPGRDAFFVPYSLSWQSGLPTRLSQGKTKSSSGVGLP